VTTEESTTVWIRTIDPAEASGRLKEAYDGQARRLGKPTEFTQLGSLDAEIVHARLVLYRATENVESTLTFRQRALISYLTSVLNSTPHCAALSPTHLRQAHEDDLIAILDRGDYGQLGPADAALARYVHKVTVAPGSVSEDDIEALRAAGFGDVDILDANNRTAHLNYTNRAANGLGLLSEPVEEKRSLTRVPGYEEEDDDDTE
jgi:uncharacterized peroxidase-related enzyme